MILGNQQSISDVEGQINEQLNAGLVLAGMRDRVLYEDRFGGDTKITMGECIEGLEEGSWMQSGTAMMLENMRKFYARMSETTRLVNIGDFEKYSFDMVRALFPSLIAHEIASTQPMPGPTSQVFFQKFIYNTTKGSAIAGQDIIENPNEDYASELIDVENLGIGDGATDNFTGNLAFTPVRPGTVSISDGTEVVTDDGNGLMIGDISGGTNTINYDTGAYDFDFTTAPTLGDSIDAQYNYDSEANTQLPEIDMTLTSSPVSAIRRPLRTKWSVEAEQDLKTVYGMSAEVEQVAAVTSELKFEIDREIVRDVKNISVNTVTAFSKTPGASISFTEHKLGFVDKVIEASNSLFSSTQRAVATWIIGGINVASLVESLPGFSSLPKPANTRGVFKSGSLNGNWDFFKDPTYPGSTRNSTDANGWMAGYKGVSMWEIGYIFAPYILLYTTPTVALDDFVVRKGIASRYGKKPIEGRFYSTSSITA